ncbi:MAG: queuosine precursor transporter [Flavobacteriales bacterium]|nr:queuosine precursor transporter [Flavobacteriales bacterium]
MTITTNSTRREWLFVILAGFFITNAVTAELISNKLIDIPFSFSLFGREVGPFVTIIGVLPWPVVFLVTDVINEFYGKQAIRKLSWITAALIAYCFIMVIISMSIPANTTISPYTATDAEYNKVFGQSRWVIVGSIMAFLVSQILDATLFAWIKSKTGNRMIWLRSTGSTVISQLIDSYIVLYIGFILPGTLSMSAFWEIAPTNYVLKLIIAILLTPLIYLGHWAVRKYLGEAHQNL